MREHFRIKKDKPHATSAAVELSLIFLAQKSAQIAHTDYPALTEAVHVHSVLKDFI